MHYSVEPRDSIFVKRYEFLSFVTQKAVEVTGNLIGNRIAQKITKVLKSSPQNNFESETEIIKETNISLEERQQIIDELRLI